MSRSRQLRPLRGDLPDTTRTLLEALRSLREHAGYDLRALGSRTYASRSSWGRWLSGETWIPIEAVETLAEVCGGDVPRLRALWRQADEDRRSPRAVAPAETESAVSAAPEWDRAAAPATARLQERPSASQRVVTPTPSSPEPSAPAEPASSPEPAAPHGPLAPHGPAQREPASPYDARTRRHARPAWTLITAVSVGCAVVAGAVGMVTGMSVRPDPPSPGPPHRYTESMTRPEVISRARTWHPHSARRIRYDLRRSFGGYRTDGSGYASMALGLPAPGPNSTDLAWGGYTRQIRAADLRPGDLIINASGDVGTRQVAIFERWTNASHTGYWVYQQRRRYGTDHLVLSYGLAAGGDYHPYRPLNIQDRPAKTPAT